MKKYIILFSILISQSVLIVAQSSSQLKNTIAKECPYIIESTPIGVYDREYGYLMEEHYDTIIYRLNDFLKHNNIQESRKYNYALDAWNILMRIRVIKWTTHKLDIENYLNKFLSQILMGNSYLNEENRNVLKDPFGCYYGNGDPVKFLLLVIG